MLELINNSFKLRLILGGIIILAAIAAAPVILPALWVNNDTTFQVSAASADGNQPQAAGNDPALLTNMESAADGFVAATRSALQKPAAIAATISSGVARGFTASTSTVARVSTSAYRGTVRGVTFASHNTLQATLLIADAPGKAILATPQLPRIVGSFIRPSESAKVPVIDSQLYELYAAHKTSESADKQATPHLDTTAAWPIHGAVTTLFGVYHRPYQDTHTGIDISSGKRSGVTAIMPFKSGTVIDVIRSSRGLGNHVLVDHGEGITSVYAHLASITVQKGQVVDPATVLGYEGSTGVSTGTHLHFEIRLNGVPVDPHQYITGQP